jgi:hypothetical protein
VLTMRRSIRDKRSTRKAISATMPGGLALLPTAVAIPEPACRSRADTVDDADAKRRAHPVALRLARAQVSARKLHAGTPEVADLAKTSIQRLRS